MIDRATGEKKCKCCGKWIDLGKPSAYCNRCEIEIELEVEEILSKRGDKNE